jgi:hypothetical protein
VALAVAVALGSAAGVAVAAGPALVLETVAVRLAAAVVLERVPVAEPALAQMCHNSGFRRVRKPLLWHKCLAGRGW